MIFLNGDLFEGYKQATGGDCEISLASQANALTRFLQVGLMPDLKYK